MKKIYLDFLVSKKEQNKLSYEELSVRVNMSVSKLQRIFTGQTDPSVGDFETICETGLHADVSEVYAQIGAQEFRDSAALDFKGAKELLQDFAAEKKQIRSEYDLRIAQSIQARTDTQHAFESAMRQMEEQYNKNVEYLRKRVADAETQSVSLAARAARAEEIAQAAQKRAEAAELRATQAEERRNELDKRRHHMFWGMLVLIAVLASILAVIVIANVPQLGGGNV